MSKMMRCCCFAVMMSFTLMIVAGSVRAQEAKFDSDSISGLGARNIGSATMSGRVSAIAAIKEDGRLTVYVGSASGGVWKSSNGGTTFKPVFNKEAVQSIGALAIDPQAPKTIWAGTGEAWTRNSVSIGNGIYKSTDGGDSWTNMGLPNSERISKIIVDPKDGNTVYACVPGKLWSDSEDRGLYKTADGGKTWNKILKGCKSFDRLLDDFHESAGSQSSFRWNVGFSAERLDVPLGRRESHGHQRQWFFSDRGWRSDVDRTE